MRSPIPQKPESLHHSVAHRGQRTVTLRRPALLAVGLTVFMAQLLTGILLDAQTPATPASAHSPSHTHRKPAAAKPAALQVQALDPAPPIPVAPPLPNWPANKKPAEASVVWDSQGLFIQASNSSLDQILKEVSLKIGAKVEGMGADERIFGTYGPGPAREVLNELLDGSGYNILMIGDQGEGTPRRVVLSVRPTGPSKPSGNANPSANNQNDPENDQEAQQASEPEQPQPGEQPRVPAFGPGAAVPVRNPQEIFQQRQQQMMQMQQQQQQQQQNNPQN